MIAIHFNFPMGSNYVQQSQWTSVQYEVTNEWKMTSMGTQNGPAYSRTVYMQLRRQSTLEDVVIKGTIKLYKGEKCVHLQQFWHLVQIGVQIAVVGFGVFNDDFSRDEFSIRGTLRIMSPYEKSDIDSMYLSSNDYEHFVVYEGAQLSDVTFKCGAQFFSAHKIILSSRSPVFSSMFTTDTNESNNNQVEITDISPQIFKILLFYIYTGETGELTFDLAKRLLFAAEKYQLLELWQNCTEFLNSFLSTDYSLDVISLTYRHEAELRRIAFEFVHNRVDVIENDFDNLGDWNPALYEDFLRFVEEANLEKRRRG